MPAPPFDRRTQNLIAALVLFWLVLLLASYHRTFPPGTLPGHAVMILVAAAVLAAAWGIGSLLVDRILASRAPRALAIPLNVAIGLGAMELLMLSLVAAGLATPPAAWGLVAFGAATAGARRKPLLESLQGIHEDWKEARGAWWAKPALAPLFAVWTLALGAALAPPEFYDALIYHLAVPDLYLRAGHMAAIEGNLYAGYPANQGMLYALGLLLLPDRLAAGSLAQLLHLAAAPLAAFAVFAIGARHLGAKTGLLAAILMATLPALTMVSRAPIADLAVLLQGTIATMAVLESVAPGAARRRWCWIAGVCAGLAAGTKYTAVLTIAVPVGCILAARARRADPSRLRDLAAFAIGAVITVSPWLARNAVVYHNPLAPYFASIFGGESGSRTLSEEIDQRLPDEQGTGALALYYLTSPWRIATERLGAGGYAGPALLFLIPLVLLRRGHPGAAGTLGGLLLAGWIAWSAGPQLTRYLFPVLPAASLLAALGAATLARAAPRARWALAAGIAWILVNGVYLCGVLLMTINPFGVVLGIEPPEDYLARRVDYYPAAAFVNESLPEGTKVLLVGEGRGYYLERPYAASTPFDRILIAGYAERARSERRPLALVLREQGFTHLMVNRREMRRISEMRGRRAYFGEESPEIAAGLEALVGGTDPQARTLFERNGVSVLELAPWETAGAELRSADEVTAP